MYNWVVFSIFAVIQSSPVYNFGIFSSPHKKNLCLLAVTVIPPFHGPWQPSYNIHLSWLFFFFSLAQCFQCLPTFVRSSVGRYLGHFHLWLLCKILLWSDPCKFIYFFACTCNLLAGVSKENYLRLIWRCIIACIIDIPIGVSSFLQLSVSSA